MGIIIKMNSFIKAALTIGSAWAIQIASENRDTSAPTKFLDDVFHPRARLNTENLACGGYWYNDAWYSISSPTTDPDEVNYPLFKA